MCNIDQIEYHNVNCDAQAFLYYKLFYFLLYYTLTYIDKQRMLERAKARREKLDEQLSNAGHDVKKRRSPLKNANALLEQATGNFSMPIYFVNSYEILIV